jgi:hypothetical protein
MHACVDGVGDYMVWGRSLSVLWEYHFLVNGTSDKSLPAFHIFYRPLNYRIGLGMHKLLVYE